MREILKEDKTLRLILRQMETADQALLNEMLNDERIEYSVTGYSLPVSMYQQRRWYTEVFSRSDRTRYLMIEADNRTIGVVILGKIDYESRVGDLGIKILPRCQGTRLTPRICQLAEEYFFTELNMNCLQFTCLEMQLASLRLIRGLGFTIEGIQTKAIYKNGRWHNLIWGSKLYHEYEEQRREG